MKLNTILIAVVAVGAGLALYVALRPQVEETLVQTSKYDRPSVAVDPAFKKQADAAFEFTNPNSYIGEYAHSGNFYALATAQDASEGGGGWAIVKRDDTSLEIIAQGQDTPECEIVNSKNVPIDLVQYCRIESKVFDRTTNKELIDPSFTLFY